MSSPITAQDFLQITQASSLLRMDPNDLLPANSIAFPLGELQALGEVFSFLPSAMASLTQDADAEDAVYEATFPAADTLREDAEDFGSPWFDDGAAAGKIRFGDVKEVVRAGSAFAMVYKAFSILAVKKAMREIARTGQEILGFLELDKQTQLKGDLTVLSDILEDYPYNWNNPAFCNHREMQVLDIRRNAEQNMLFYRERIAQTFGKTAMLRLDTARILQDVQNQFRYYKLALYLYAFAVYLDTLLLENFEKSYLSAVIEKLDRYAAEYDAFYRVCMENVEKSALSSLQSKAIIGLSAAGKFAGRQLGRIPDKLNKLRMDERLVAGSERLDRFHEQSIEQTVGSFATLEDGGISHFSDRLRLLQALYSRPLQIVFDAQTVYLPLIESAQTT